MLILDNDDHLIFEDKFQKSDSIIRLHLKDSGRLVYQDFNCGPEIYFPASESKLMQA